MEAYKMLVLLLRYIDISDFSVSLGVEGAKWSQTL